jgi:hypothetical protein
MRGIWRFFREGDAGWKWQRLSINKVVMAESRVTFAEYAECVHDATQKGYDHRPSQEKIRPRFAPNSYNDPYVPPADDVLRMQGMQDGGEKRTVT